MEYECDCNHKEQIECLIDMLTELAKSSDESLFDKIFSKVAKALKVADAPEEIENVNNAWDFLGVINYHGGDHFLYQATMDELESTVVSVINKLPLHERFLVIVANSNADDFFWNDFKSGITDVDANAVMEYFLKKEPFWEAVERLTKTIQSHAPDYCPCD